VPSGHGGGVPAVASPNARNPSTLGRERDDGDNRRGAVTSGRDGPKDLGLTVREERR